MKSILQILTFQRTVIGSIFILLVLSLFSFYGPYTGNFYFFKASNYVVPVLTLIHMTFLYVLWFKIREDELTDPPMRNLEYGLYLILVIYLYKGIDSIYVLTTFKNYENHVLPAGFLAIGILITLLYFVLLGFTLLTFKYRKDKIGDYKFDDMNHIDSWE